MNDKDEYEILFLLFRNIDDILFFLLRYFLKSKFINFENYRFLENKINRDMIILAESQIPDKIISFFENL